jgi:hypothetical protein
MSLGGLLEIRVGRLNVQFVFLLPADQSLHEAGRLGHEIVEFGRWLGEIRSFCVERGHRQGHF